MKTGGLALGLRRSSQHPHPSASSASRSASCLLMQLQGGSRQLAAPTTGPLLPIWEAWVVPGPWFRASLDPPGFIVDGTAHQEMKDQSLCPSPFQINKQMSKKKSKNFEYSHAQSLLRTAVGGYFHTAMAVPSSRQADHTANYLLSGSLPTLLSHAAEQSDHLLCLHSH